MLETKIKLLHKRNKKLPSGFFLHKLEKFMQPKMLLSLKIKKWNKPDSMAY